jgi:4-amino-4-deoxy-L-arabinose transferase-like glycosyltransferase
MKRLLNDFFRDWSRTLSTIFVAALLVRVVFILTLQDGFYFPDSVDYSRAAVNILTNGELGERYHRPPGYPVFLAGIYSFFGESIVAVRMVESVMGAFLAVVIALLGRRIGGEVVGVLAGILWGIYPLGVFIAGLVYPTNLLTMLLACGLLCFLPESQQELSAKRVFLAGIIWGLAALTTPVVLATVGAISLWVMYWSRANRLLLISVLFLGSALTVVPWIIRDFYVYDRLVVVEPRVFQQLPQMDKTQKNVPEKKIEAILEHPRVFAERYASEFKRFWLPYPERLVMDWPTVREKAHERDGRILKDTIFTKNILINAAGILTTGPLFFFAIIGTAAMWFQREQRCHLSLLWAIILSFAAVYSIFYAKMRYRIPVEPYIIILSAYGIKKTWEVLKKFDVRGSKLEVEARQVEAQAEVQVQAQVGDVRGSKFEV